MQKWWRFGDLNSSSYSSGDERDVDDNALLNVEGNAGPGLFAEAFHGHRDGVGTGVERRGPIFSRRAGLSSEAQAGVRSLDFDCAEGIGRPDGSVMVPRMIPVSTCPQRRPVKREKRNKESKRVGRRVLCFI